MNLFEQTDWGHINLFFKLFTGLLTKEVKLELKNFSDLSKNRMKPSYGLPPCGNGVDFDPNAPSAAHTLTNIRVRRIFT